MKKKHKMAIFCLIMVVTYMLLFAFAYAREYKPKWKCDNGYIDGIKVCHIIKLDGAVFRRVCTLRKTDNKWVCTPSVETRLQFTQS